MKNSFYIIPYRQDIIIVNKEIDENDFQFVERIKFMMKALKLSYSLDVAESLSFAHRNKLLTSSVYSREVENNINSVLNNSTIN